MPSYTIKKPITIDGIGMHSGKKCSLVIEPYKKEGTYFRKKGKPIIKITPQKLIGKSRATHLKYQKGTITTIEHTLAVLYLLKIQNVLLTLNGNEFPAMDGSGKILYHKIKKVIVKRMHAGAPPLTIPHQLYVFDNYSFIIANPAKSLSVTYIYEHSHPKIGIIKETWTSKDSPQKLINARTFGFLENYEQLKKQGKARGANFKNVLVFTKKGIKGKMRFKNEFVYHKILDFIGDIGILGRELNADIICYRSGHVLNNKFLKKLITI
ncbi:UDP-3-O-acyl-N-acetylglucosamine deacetylase [Candidatus Margulisiibacteriota bacterium]